MECQAIDGSHLSRSHRCESFDDGEGCDACARRSSRHRARPARLSREGEEPSTVAVRVRRGRRRARPATRKQLSTTAARFFDFGFKRSDAKRSPTVSLAPVQLRGSSALRSDTCPGARDRFTRDLLELPVGDAQEKSVRDSARARFRAVTATSLRRAELKGVPLTFQLSSGHRAAWGAFFSSGIRNGTRGAHSQKTWVAHQDETAVSPRSSDVGRPSASSPSNSRPSGFSGMRFSQSQGAG